MGSVANGFGDELNGLQACAVGVAASRVPMCGQVSLARCQMPDASATTWMDGLELKLGTGKRRRGSQNNIPVGSQDNVGCLEMRLVGNHSQQAARARW